MAAVRTSLAGLLAAALFGVAACGDDGADDASSTASAATETNAAAGGSSPCGSIEEVEVALGGQHLDDDFTAADYPTNPPAGGDHNPTPLEAGGSYRTPPPLGEAVHLLEHGAVIGWTNGLSGADRSAVEGAFNEVAKDGYYQLAVVEDPELDVPFALSAWGALQKCEEADPTAVRPFVEQWYASPKTAEGGLACQEAARELPNC